MPPTTQRTLLARAARWWARASGCRGRSQNNGRLFPPAAAALNNAPPLPTSGRRAACLHYWVGGGGWHRAIPCPPGGSFVMRCASCRCGVASVGAAGFCSSCGRCRGCCSGHGPARRVWVQVGGSSQWLPLLVGTRRVVRVRPSGRPAGWPVRRWRLSGTWGMFGLRRAAWGVHLLPARPARPISQRPWQGVS